MSSRLRSNACITALWLVTRGLLVTGASILTVTLWTITTNPAARSDDEFDECEKPAGTSYGFKIATETSSHKYRSRRAPRTESSFVISQTLADLNNNYTLPADIRVLLKDCGYPDTYYTNETHEITICTEWVDLIQTVLLREHSHQVRAQNEADELLAAVTLHEAAHALIHILKLPITGREEDVADQFSTLMLMTKKDGETTALHVARMYHLFSEVSTAGPQDYSDEHSLDAQRYYDTLCMIYGRDPVVHQNIVERWLPLERATACEDDFRRIQNSWDTLLRPFTKQ
jgi:hypothetical protein